MSVRLIVYAPAARRDLKSIPATELEAVVKGIERLAADDPSIDTKKLGGSDALRLRVGRWRVFYDLQVDDGAVLVLRVRSRDKAYGRRKR